MAIEFYKEFGELGYLANYSDYGFYKNGIHYKTVEHYYQSEKFSNKKIKDSIINCDSPKDASNIGRDRNNKRIENFKDIKLKVMEDGVYLKFSQNKDIRSKLIETGRNIIREMSVKESFWGVGPSKRGDNHIGIILMNVRRRVKEDLLNEIIEKCKNKKIYILGHRKPDCDSVFSAVVLARILKSYGIDAQAAVRDTDYVEKDLINDYLDEDVEVVSDYSNKYFILVDHNNLDGIAKENVIGAIDHHKITGEVEDLIEIEYSSCGLLIYDLFKDRYSFSKDDKLMLALTVLSDTEYLSSRRFSSYDKNLYNEIGLYLDYKYLKKKYLPINTNLEDINANLYCDFKEYNYCNTSIKRSLIKNHSFDKNMFNKYIKSMKKNVIDLLIWCNYDDNSTYVCYKNKCFKFIYFTTSTYLVLDYLKKKGYV